MEFYSLNPMLEELFKVLSFDLGPFPQIIITCATTAFYVAVVVTKFWMVKIFLAPKSVLALTKRNNNISLCQLFDTWKFWNYYEWIS